MGKERERAKERGQACKHANKTANGFGGSVTSVSYNTAGLPTSFSYSNGIANSITYNSRNFTTRIQAGTTLDVGYGYDSRGNTSSMTDYLDSAKNQSFGYDSLSRLTSFNGAWGTGSYSYDSTGNRMSKTVAGVTTNYSYTSNRVSSTSGGESLTFSYNGYGSVTGTSCSGGNTLTYDMLNNLKDYKLGSNTLASFGYDGDGIRVTKTTWKTIVYHYDKDGRVISETDSNGNLIADNIYLNGKLIAKAEPSNLYFYHVDPAGTALAMTNTSGSVVWKTDYKPFGEEQSITSTIENNEKFAGKEKDKETGLYYFGARYLGPKIGRFITVDPVGISEKDLLNPQRLNRYAYSLNNPYRYVDPDGRLTVNIWNYRGKNDAWGHASITLENGRHISWWPRSEGREGLLRFMNIYTAPANDPQEFKDDVLGEEGRKPDFQIKIKGLDEKKIENWWKEFKKTNQWKTLSQNCSTTAADALKAGGAEDYSSWGSSHNVVWTPNDVKSFADEIKKNIEDK